MRKSALALVVRPRWVVCNGAIPPWLLPADLESQVKRYFPLREEEALLLRRTNRGGDAEEVVITVPAEAQVKFFRTKEKSAQSGSSRRAGDSEPEMCADKYEDGVAFIVPNVQIEVEGKKSPGQLTCISGDVSFTRYGSAA